MTQKQTCASGAGQSASGRHGRGEEVAAPASKSQLKREAKASLDFAEELVREPIALLQQLPLSSSSLQALCDYAKMDSHIARKRHLMYMGKCLRSDDIEAVRQALSDLGAEQVAQKLKSARRNLDAQLELADTCCRLDGEQFEALLLAYPQLSRQTLRQLQRNCGKQKTPGKQQKLARYLHHNGVERIENGH